MRFLHDYTLREARFGACLLGLLTVSLLAGCGGGGSNGNSGGGTTTTGTATTGTGITTGTGTGGTQPLTVTGTSASGLTASLTEASATVSVGGTLVYTLTLTNNTAAAVPVQATSTPSQPSAVLTIIGPTGSTSFQQLPGAPPLANGSLAAGQSISLTETANGFTAAGTYSASAGFSDTNPSTTVGPLKVTAQ